jgi:hypothetical protein
MVDLVCMSLTDCFPHIFLVRSHFVSLLPSKDETFLTLSFGAEDKPNNNNFNNFLSEI